ncbi:MAG: Athe_2463 domain-containing protein [Bacillota bacterium]
MIKKLISFLVVITLFTTGLYFSPAQAGSDYKLERILRITGMAPEQTDVIGKDVVTLKARLDRDLLVYGLPSDIPDNQWKPAPTSWEKDNGNKYNLGHPGNEEPRYLGKTFDWNDFANDYFPDDAEYHIAPARRSMIEKPWYRNLEIGDNGDISEYSWGLIIKALETYHQRIGFEDKDGFANNPAFIGDFNNNVKNYFKVLAEPRPGMAGAARHWHHRKDLGGVWYDPIFIRWDILPNFMVESIDPGTDKAQPGQTYTGRVVLKAKPDGSFASDPVTSQLFNAMGLKLELPQDYVVPFGVAVNGRMVPIKNFQPVSGLENIYQYKVPAGTKEDILQFTFEWTVPAAHSESIIIVATGVNESMDVLPKDVWGYMDWSEITNLDNAKAVEVPVELGLPDLKIELSSDRYNLTRLPGGGGDGANITAVITRKDNLPGDVPANITLHNLTSDPIVIPYTFGPGGQHAINFPMAPFFTTTITGEVWPVGKDDAYPPDNTGSLTLTVTELSVPRGDSGVIPSQINTTKY